MASSFFLLKNLITLLQDTLNDDLDDGMPGLDIAATLPTDANQLPIIVVSFAKVEEEAIGIGDILEIKRQLGSDTEIVRANRIGGEMIFQIWIKKNEDKVLEKIDNAAELLSNSLEEHKNELRIKGLLKNRLSFVGTVESSENAPVWLIQTKTLGKRLTYNFVYEYVAEEVPTVGVLEQVRVEEIWLDDTPLTETMVIPNE